MVSIAGGGFGVYKTLKNGTLPKAEVELPDPYKLTF